MPVAPIEASDLPAKPSTIHVVSASSPASKHQPRVVAIVGAPRDCTRSSCTQVDVVAGDRMLAKAYAKDIDQMVSERDRLEHLIERRREELRVVTARLRSNNVRENDLDL